MALKCCRVAGDREEIIVSPLRSSFLLTRTGESTTALLCAGTRLVSKLCSFPRLCLALHAMPVTERKVRAPRLGDLPEFT